MGMGGPRRRPATSGLGRRLAWLAAAVALGAFAIYEVIVHDLGPLPILIFVLLPDVAFLAGVGRRHEPGQLPPRVVPAYNFAHQPRIPLILIGLALGALLIVRLLVHAPAPYEEARFIPLVVYVAAISWLAHIAFDRALGLGPRTADGWPR